MAISAADKLCLIKSMLDDYMEFGGYADDAKSAASLDQLVNCVWLVVRFDPDKSDGADGDGASEVH